MELQAGHGQTPTACTAGPGSPPRDVLKLLASRPATVDPKEADSAALARPMIMAYTWKRTERTAMTTTPAASPGRHMIVLPGGGYAAHAPHEAEPVARWLGEIGVQASVFRYPLNVRHPVPLDALRAEIGRRRAAGARRIGLIGFSAGGHLAGLAALAPGAGPDQTVQFVVLGYAITSMQTETYRPARLILLGEDASPELRRSTSLDALVTPQAPPFFVWHTAEDPYVPPEHSYRFASALAVRPDHASAVPGAPLL